MRPNDTVKVKNIADKDISFTYGGVQRTIRKGAVVEMTYAEARHGIKATIVQMDMQNGEYVSALAILKDNKKEPEPVKTEGVRTIDANAMTFEPVPGTSGHGKAHGVQNAEH
jgi:hypothetical protein